MSTERRTVEIAGVWWWGSWLLMIPALVLATGLLEVKQAIDRNTAAVVMQTATIREANSPTSVPTCTCTAMDGEIRMDCTP